MPSPSLILVHGLWMGKLELSYLRRRFANEYAYDVHTFSYSSIRQTMADHVRALRKFAQSLQAGQLHFIGHSLGGVVILRLLESTDDLPPGRAVLLGSPLQGSRAALGIAKLPFGNAILGSAIREDVLGSGPRSWSGHRDVGVIAGSLGAGLGRVFGNLTGVHDGTVMLEETQLPGAKDHLVMAVSHTGMVFSAEVAKQADQFLRTGQFDHTID